MKYDSNNETEVLQPYGDYAPTAVDTRGLGLEGRQDWLVFLGRNRDSGLVSESNWEVALAELERLDPDGVDYETHTFGHWACGWVEVCIVRPRTKASKYAYEATCALSNYPILDEMHHSECEREAMYEVWTHAPLRERIEYCRRAGASIFAARRDEIPESVYAEHLGVR